MRENVPRAQWNQFPFINANAGQKLHFTHPSSWDELFWISNLIANSNYNKIIQVKDNKLRPFQAKFSTKAELRQKTKNLLERVLKKFIF